LIFENGFVILLSAWCTIEISGWIHVNRAGYITKVFNMSNSLIFNILRAASALRGGVSDRSEPEKLSIERKKREIPTFESETGQLYGYLAPSDSQDQWG
jgi:hypothetical protein